MSFSRPYRTLSISALVLTTFVTIANAQVKPVDTSKEADREPDIRELFSEWRTTSARGIMAPHDDVTAMFGRAVGGEQVTVAELGIHDTVVAVQATLEELAQARVGAAGTET